MKPSQTLLDLVDEINGYKREIDRLKGQLDIDSKVKELLNLTNNFIYTEWYSHEQAICFKIDNEYTKYAKETTVLCKVSEGIEKALRTAIEVITVKKAKFYE